MKLRSFAIQFVLAASLLGLALLALAYAMPHLMRIPDVDSSIFQYFGERMREGQLPYRDVYDHKPPLIFYLNYWGLMLGGGSRWGIWALELIAVGSSALIGFTALKRFYGVLPAWVASAGFLMNLVFVHEGGNLTEEYALPFQFAAIGLLLEMERRRQGGWWAFCIGVCIAMASTLKQPLAGPLVATGILMLWTRLARKQWRGLIDFIWLGLGFLAVWGGWFAFFALRGIFPEFWEAAFAYNFALSGISTSQRLDALLEALYFLQGVSPFYVLGFTAWMAGIVYLLFHEDALLRVFTSRAVGWLAGLAGLVLVYRGMLRSGLTFSRIGEMSLYRRGLLVVGVILLVGGLAYAFRRLDRSFYRWLLRWQEGHSTPLFLPLAFAVIDLPVELGLSSLSGNNFRHYFMALLPALTLLTGFLVWWLARPSKGENSNLIRKTWVVVFMIPLLLTGVLNNIDKITVQQDKTLTEVIEYVKQHTDPEDYVLQWGNLPMINVVSGRKAPSRFFFIDPLFLPNYTNEFHTGTFLAELQAHPPQLIIDSRPLIQPLFYEYNAADCSKLSDRDYLEELARAIRPKRPISRSISDYRDRYFKPPQIPPGMPEVYRWICENYDEETVLGEWIVFRYMPGRK
ncbi:4-amino-4-deoxy-L-arabinose transferase [Anaerolinea thermolimosa]|uniref:ArnT family glycosyltransferase n=1 Tax=Anaerolinea thermolimosa TaxID=229919 RepID=UPI0007813100|nr:hypothetical protein [Anaerolinea thermolimosa]GAP05295.1 4-amino-4-deoxy-L-arabinose transferase [Anaerolinea thermolimosa]